MAVRSLNKSSETYLNAVKDEQGRGVQKNIYCLFTLKRISFHIKGGGLLKMSFHMKSVIDTMTKHIEMFKPILTSASGICSELLVLTHLLAPDM